jgi:hypothetical protein
LTYLYSSGNLFIPAELYGKIFYFIGLASILLAMMIFLIELRPYSWELTTEIKALEDIKQKDESEYLEYVKKEYINCFNANSKTYEMKHRSFNLGFILLTVGAFTLIIIKTFPQELNTCYTSSSSTCNITQTKEGQNK